MLKDSLQISAIDEIKDFIKSKFCQCINIDPEVISDEDSFFSLGLTSLIHEEFIQELNNEFNGLSSTVLFEYPSIDLLTFHIFGGVRDHSSAENTTQTEMVN